MATPSSQRSTFLTIGLMLWAAGTVILRVAGHRVFPAGLTGTLILYAISFVLFAAGVPFLFTRLGVPRERWPYAAAWLILPTLLLDPLTCALFTSVFPNMPATAAGAFGGWMLICCGGAVAGTLRRT
jgi:hypothetical protein